MKKAPPAGPAAAAGAAREEVRFGPEVCGQIEAAEQREWLVTNGIGGFASGTVAGHLTRRYHGLLIAALKPPVGRTLLVAKLEETAQCDGRSYALSANRWADGTLAPQGYRQIESFRLEGTMPVWTFTCGDALLQKRVWMQAGANTTYVVYRLARGSGALDLDCRAFVNYRDFHGVTHAGDWRMNIEAAGGGLRVTAFEGAAPFYLRSEAACEPAHTWYRNFDLSEERSRGLDDREDHLHAGTFRIRLNPGDSVALVLSTEPSASLDARAAWEARAAQEKSLLDRWAAAYPQAAAAAPGWIRQLVLAADQFIVRRALPEDPEGRSAIAGYHWFGDWGRDTMIALPGLTLATGRPEIARKILLAFSRYVDQGMLPNHFPDAGGQPEYNTVDAALWYFEAVRQYYAATRDAGLLGVLYAVLAGMIEAHVRGTRYAIRADLADGLLFAGEPGVQLTWMDAKVGDWVVTPRIGKPVEVNALWFNALVTMGQFSRVLGQPGDLYIRLAARVQENFGRFWNAQEGCCFDVIDSPGIGKDASPRPNQIFAVSLPASPLAPEQQRAVVEFCARHLLTSHGLRSLAPGDPRYQGRYAGGPRERDACYHQGTVWGWLIGPFVLAHLLVYQDPVRALSFLEPYASQLQTYGLGTLPEIHDGDPPFAPRGCIAQAWTVGEVLRAWQACVSYRWD